MQTLRQDIGYGVRMLRARIGFTVAAVLTIALGIGANTAIFSVVNSVLLRPLPYAEPERLAALYENDRRQPGIEGAISYPNFFDWRAQNSAFERMAVYRDADIALAGTESSVHLNGQVASYDLFQVLGVAPALGRSFTEEEDRSGSARVAVISHSLWKRQFGGDPQIIGRSVTLDQKPFQIIGVMPAGFQFPIQVEPPEIWITSAYDAEPAGDRSPRTERRGFRWLEGIARLKPGVTLGEAQADMSAIAARLEAQYPDNNSFSGATVAPFHRSVVGDYRKPLLVLFGAVACVLLVACANVANLLLARASTRAREIAVRAALGADRVRLVRQLLTESLLLAAIGGVLGLLVAWWGVEGIVRLIPEDVPRAAEIGIDRTVFAFTLIASVLTGMLFGLAPAWQASKVDLVEAMKDGSRGAGARRGGLRSALIVAEVAVACVLLVGASLLVQTFRELQRVDLGFDMRNVLTASVELPNPQYSDPAKRVEFFGRLLERVRALPGVEGASAILPLPLSGASVSGSFEIEGRPVAQGEEPNTRFRWIETGYFETMKIPVLRGRDISDRDDARAPLVVLVNESFVGKHFPDEDPLGKRVQLPFGPEGSSSLREIVGVVRDVRSREDLSEGAGVEMYMPHKQGSLANGLTLAVRSNADPIALSRAVERELTAMDRSIPLYRVRTLEQYFGNAVARPRFSALLFGLFAVAALLLAAVGLYGVMSYAVEQRTHEFGIRLALGARPRDVLRLTMRRGMMLAGTGIAMGAAASLALAQMIESLLHGVDARDPWTIAGIALLLGAVAAAACYLPARRATRVDPMIALRYE
ncbi:MAG: ABC transporter permease [Blastocatellales bacterium]|nr:ABC transporter permease [Blastocatellales bacterium]